MNSETTLRIARELAVSRHAMVAAKHPWAVQAALDILDRGGNAVDAAVTAAFAIGVLEPWMSGIGGGGFMTVQMAGGERQVIDYFSRAPRAATPDMYEMTGGSQADAVGFSGVKDDANAYGPLSVAVPGMVAGMALALERFGTKEWGETLAPAIDFAERGFPIDWYRGMLIGSEQAVIRRDAETARIFLRDGIAPAPHFGGQLPTLAQPDLARTLRQIAANGPDGFYRGEIAEQIAAHLHALGGILTTDDLAAYEPTVVDPLVLPYRDVELVLLPFQAASRLARRSTSSMARTSTRRASTPPRRCIRSRRRAVVGSRIASPTSATRTITTWIGGCSPRRNMPRVAVRRSTRAVPPDHHRAWASCAVVRRRRARRGTAAARHIFRSWTRTAIWSA